MYVSSGNLCFRCFAFAGTVILFFYFVIFLYSNCSFVATQIAAELEEEKIRCMQAEKAARLKQFQEDVKRRVRQINKAKRKQQLQNDITNVNILFTEFCIHIVYFRLSLDMFSEHPLHLLDSRKKMSSQK